MYTQGKKQRVLKVKYCAWFCHFIACTWEDNLWTLATQFVWKIASSEKRSWPSKQVWHLVDFNLHMCIRDSTPLVGMSVYCNTSPSVVTLQRGVLCAVPGLTTPISCPSMAECWLNVCYITGDSYIECLCLSVPNGIRLAITILLNCL